MLLTQLIKLNYPVIRFHLSFVVFTNQSLAVTDELRVRWVDL